MEARYRAAAAAKGLMALSSLGKLLLDLMNRKSILQIEPELLGSPEMASRAAISRVIPRFSRTMSLTVGGETRSSTPNR
jgi:hypothetical protein